MPRRGAAYRAFSTAGTRSAPAAALLREAGLEHLIQGGYARSVRASPWPLHDHTNFEIHFFVRGTSRCWVGGDLRDVRGGQILVVSPSVVHLDELMVGSEKSSKSGKVASPSDPVPMAVFP